MNKEKIVSVLESVRSLLAILAVESGNDVNKTMFFDMVKTELGELNKVIAHLRPNGSTPTLHFKDEFAEELRLNPQAQELYEDLRKQIVHWKSNHDNQVKLKHILSDRLDLPLERSQAAQYVEEVMEENKKLKAELEQLRSKA